MTDERAFLTLTHLADQTRHAEYNEWHQLDHLPENMLLKGVAWGNRWVRTPECIGVSYAPDETLATSQYAVMYAFRSPANRSVQEWTDLNQRAIWWGRRPELEWTLRNPLGFFETVKAYAAPRVLVSADAIPHRPHRGIHLTVSRIAEPESPASVQLMRDYDREFIPYLLEVDGVAGVQTYRFGGGAAAFGGASAEAAEASGLLVRLAFLDGDPIATTEAIYEQQPLWIRGNESADAAEQVLLSAPFESISPWQWDWFDDAR